MCSLKAKKKAATLGSQMCSGTLVAQQHASCVCGDAIVVTGVCVANVCLSPHTLQAYNPQSMPNYIHLHGTGDQEVRSCGGLAVHHATGLAAYATALGRATRQLASIS